MTASITIAQPATTAEAPKADATTTPATTTTTTPAAPAKVERPTWLPEKFKDPEQLAAAYGELEKKLGGNQPAEQKPAEQKPETPATTEQKPGHDQAVADVLKANGFDYDTIAGEFAEKGELKPETAEKLYSKFGRQVVDNYFAGQKALADAYTAKVHDMAGGKDGHDKMVSWAAANLSNDQKLAYNAAVNSGDTAKAQLAISGLKAQFDAASGTEPSLLNGDNGLKSSGDVFRSYAEVTREMRDPRYQKDAAFRKDIADKLARSNL